MIFKLIFFLFILISHNVFGQEIIKGKAKIIDGDTINIGSNKIRLYGIDAPEINQTCLKKTKEWLCGVQSKIELINIINNEALSCKIIDIDRYKRLIGECFINQININQKMVKQGWALAYRYYSLKYVGDEIFAKQKRNGIWQSIFENPWDYRKKK